MGERCPECAAVSVGAAMSCNDLDRHSVYYERNIFPERQGAPQTCEREWSCSACGYNRRGLSITKPCPECGHIERDTLAPLDKPGFAPWLTMKIN